MPYGDPAPQQARKNAFDAGEYGMGMCANSLELGCDCLGLIQYFDAHLCDSRGEPLTIKNAICMHEEDFGILWKHTDRRLPDKPEVRRSRRLVDLVDLDGRELRVRLLLVSLPGRQHPVRDQADRHPVAGRACRRARSRSTAALIAPQLYAPNHQHFFNMRLDFDLDGTAQHGLPARRGRRRAAARSNPFENAFHVAGDAAEDARKQARSQSEPGNGPHLEDRQSGRARTRSASRSATSSCRATTASRIASPNAWWRKRAGFVEPPRLGDAVPRRGEATRPATIRTRATGGDGLLAWTEARSPHRQHRRRACGTPSATRTFRGRRITR